MRLIFRVVMVFLVLVFIASGGRQSDASYADVSVGECGRVSAGGNVILPYGIEPVDCVDYEEAVRVAVGDTGVLVSSGLCWLVGEGAEARFSGSCSEYDDQFIYESLLYSAGPDEIVPDSIRPNMEPVRLGSGEIVANVWVENQCRECLQCLPSFPQSLQVLLIQKGVARVSCVPRVEGDMCYRLKAAEAAIQASSEVEALGRTW